MARQLFQTTTSTTRPLRTGCCYGYVLTTHGAPDRQNAGLASALTGSRWKAAGLPQTATPRCGPFPVYLCHVSTRCQAEECYSAIAPRLSWLCSAQVRIQRLANLTPYADLQLQVVSTMTSDASIGLRTFAYRGRTGRVTCGDEILRGPQPRPSVLPAKGPSRSASSMSYRITLPFFVGLPMHTVGSFFQGSLAAPQQA